MDKVVQIEIKKDGDNIEVSNSFGKSWKFQSHDSEYLVSSLVALSVAEHFRSYESEVKQFTMSLHVELDR
jgi:hypothetical protein